jgi:quinol monooxygenase YgiN
MSVTAIIEFTAHTDCRHQLLSILTTPVQLTRENPSCLAMQVLADNDTPDVVIFIEHWDSIASHQAHRGNLMAADHLANILPLLATELKTTYYQVVAE